MKARDDTNTLKMIHLAGEQPHPEVWIAPFMEELQALGTLTMVTDAVRHAPSEIIKAVRDHDVVLSSWGSIAVPEAVASDPGSLKYACHITGAVRGCIPLALIEAGILVSNWGDAPSQGLAEGAMALLLATLKDLHRHILCQRGQGNEDGGGLVMGSLEETPIGVYGLGVTGRRFVEMLRPFKPVIRFFDPFVTDWPEDCERVATLEDLFRRSRIIVIHAGLTDATYRSVTADMLARLPDHALLINTARGAIVDQDAITREVCAGRLRAGLDVTDPEPLPADHPLRHAPGCVITPHNISHSWPWDPHQPPRMKAMHRICLDNLRRFQRGEAIHFRMDSRRYRLST